MRTLLFGFFVCLLAPAVLAQDQAAARARLDSLNAERDRLGARLMVVDGEIAAAQGALAVVLVRNGGGVAVTPLARSASVFASTADEEPFARVTPGDSLRAFAWEPGSEGAPFWLRVVYRGRMGYVAGNLTRPFADAAGTLEALPGYGDGPRAARVVTEPDVPDEPEAPAVTPTGRPARTYYVGPRGGCYYFSNSGRKTYVDRSFCNRE